jgi:hypothetical protein
MLGIYSKDLKHTNLNYKEKIGNIIKYKKLFKKELKPVESEKYKIYL